MATLKKHSTFTKFSSLSLNVALKKLLSRSNLYSTSATPSKTLTTIDMQGLFCKNHYANTICCEFYQFQYFFIWLCMSSENLSIRPVHLVLFLKQSKQMHCFVRSRAINFSMAAQYFHHHKTKVTCIYVIKTSIGHGLHPNVVQKWVRNPKGYLQVALLGDTISCMLLLVSELNTSL